jgi:hypothetical protein
MPDTTHGDAVAQAQPGRGAASGTPPQPAVSPEARTDERRFRIYTFAVLSIGLVAAFAVGSWLPFHWDSKLLWIGPVLAVAFLLAEQLGINVDVRSGISWTISFTEIPLVIGFFVAPFEVVLAAHLIAGIGTLLARKVAGRVLYNAGAFLLEITGAFAVAGLVKYAVGAGVGDKIPWVAALAGTLTAPPSGSPRGSWSSGSSTRRSASPATSSSRPRPRRGRWCSPSSSASPRSTGRTPTCCASSGTWRRFRTSA